MISKQSETLSGAASEEPDAPIANALPATKNAGVVEEGAASAEASGRAGGPLGVVREPLVRDWKASGADAAVFCLYASTEAVFQLRPRLKAGEGVHRDFSPFKYEEFIQKAAK